MTASAPAPSVAEIEAQERELVLPRLTFEDAWDLGSLLRELAVAQDAPVAIAVHRGSRLLFHTALPGSSADNDDWIDRKRRVVERYGASSLLVGTRFRERGSSFEESSRLDPAVFAAHGGAFPLTVRDTGVVGVATVSGLPQLDDHALVVQALRTYLTRG
ncbi:heme-degrading domain-containing protein [Streptomyces sp. NPDC060194]|uniref:heme-degrading domain-containing protein n=1 Tax=Streptomyces sp. NPDC060194 TaxID=3347069 RepID=UPI00365F134B